MKNYYQSEEEKKWPTKQVVHIEEIPNTFDHRGAAARLHLECGHYCIATGDALKKVEVQCKMCGEMR